MWVHSGMWIGEGGELCVHVSLFMELIYGLGYSF